MSAFTICLIFIAALLHLVTASRESSKADAANAFGGLVIICLFVYFCRGFCCCRSRSQQNVVIVNQAAPPLPPPVYVQFV